MEFSPTFLDFSSWIYLFWKQTKINLVSEYFRKLLSPEIFFGVDSIKVFPPSQAGHQLLPLLLPVSETYNL